MAGGWFVWIEVAFWVGLCIDAGAALALALALHKRRKARDE